MKTTATLPVLLAIFLISTNSTIAQTTITGDTTYRNNLRSDIRVLSFSIDPGRQTPDYIGFRPDQGYTLSESQLVFSQFLPYRAGIDQLTQQNSTKSPGGLETIRFQQFFRNIKVEQGALTFTAKNGKTSFILSEFYAVPENTSITPGITEALAFEKARLLVNAEKYDWDEGGPLPAAQLVLVRDQAAVKGIRLAYKFDIYATRPLSRSFIYIDAADGAVLLQENRILDLHTGPGAGTDPGKPRVPFTNATATGDTRYSGTQSFTTDFTGSNYRLYQTRNGDVISTKNYQQRNQSTTNNALAVEFTDADNNWTSAEYNNATWDNAALDVQFGMQFVSDYWQNIHSRNSWDNAGGNMNSYVHVRAQGSSTSNYDNAFWLSGTNAMFYGDGTYLSGNTAGFLPLTSLDVTAHELGHAVCQTTANLAYQKESGAMNEGFSDIWGACVEAFSGLGAPKNPWLIGEEIYPSAGYLRSMSNPKSQGQPDTYLGTNWVDVSAACTPSSGNDYCGVHTNSGVLNHWFYILTVGKNGVNDIGNSYNVTGIGFTDAQKIAYATELALTTNATFANARTASINASTTLFGACSAQTIAVTNAWYAVGVGAQFVPCGAEVYYKTAVTNVAEAATPAGCPPSTKTITLTIRLENPATQQTDATLTVAGGTATNNIDYSFSPSTVTWAAGATGDRTFTVTINDDHSVEGNETAIFGFTINAHGGNAVSGSFNTTHLVNITDNEFAPTTNILTSYYGTGTVILITGSPFQGSSFTDKKMQLLYTAAQLTAAGYRKGYVSEIGFYFYQNASSGTFNNYNLNIGNTAATTLSGGFAAYTGSPVSVFSGTLNTPTGTGFGTFALPTPFYWDGVSNILIESCYDNAAAGVNVQILGDGRGASPIYNTFVTANTGNICSAAATTTSQNQPVLYVKMTDVVQTVTNQSLTAYLGPNADVAFFSASDGKIMARIKNNTSWDYGCTQVVVDRAGNGTSQFWNNNSTQYLADKTFRVLPTSNNPSGNYDITLYYTSAEHNGWETATGKDWETTAKITKVSGHDISEVTPSTTSYFSSVNVAAGTNRQTFGTDYQVTATFSTGFSGFGVGDPGSPALPVQLLSFTGVKDNNHSLLKWITASEFNNDHFDVETSKDGINFYRIGAVQGKGTTFDRQNYNFTDNLPANGANYYRLKQVDIDGHFTYSNIVLLSFDRKDTRNLVFYPNPVTDKLIFETAVPVSRITFNIYGQDGKKVYTETAGNIVRTFAIPVRELPAGVYIIEAVTAQGKDQSKFIKQ